MRGPHPLTQVCTLLTCHSQGRLQVKRTYQAEPWGSHGPRQTQQNSALQLWFRQTMWLQPPSFSMVTWHFGHSCRRGKRDTPGRLELHHSHKWWYNSKVSRRTGLAVTLKEKTWMTWSSSLIHHTRLCTGDRCWGALASISSVRGLQNKFNNLKNTGSIFMRISIFQVVYEMVESSAEIQNAENLKSITWKLSGFLSKNRQMTSRENGMQHLHKTTLKVKAHIRITPSMEAR